MEEKPKRGGPEGPKRLNFINIGHFFDIVGHDFGQVIVDHDVANGLLEGDAEEFVILVVIGQIVDCFEVQTVPILDYLDQ